MTPLEVYDKAGAQLAAAIDTYWDDVVGKDAAAKRTAIATLAPFFDTYRDACSALARETDRITQARQRARAAERMDR